MADEDVVCAIHKTHSPIAHEGDIHHIWPKGQGGPDTAENKVAVCPTGHRNVHELLERYKTYSGTPPWEIRQHWNANERALAAQGWFGIISAGTL